MTDMTNPIKLIIRTARVQKHITVEEGISVSDLRSKTAELFEVDDPQLTVLIFGGKILKDNEDIKKHDIKDGQTIHLVIRNKPSGDTSSANNSNTSNQQSSQVSQTRNNINESNNNDQNPSDGSDPNAANPLRGVLRDLQQRLHQMLITNPEGAQNLLNQGEGGVNPDLMRSLVGGMQRMQSLMESNPEVNHLLSNPELLRESLEMVRNPAALQEVMRNYDRALNNMESMPGGYNVLRRMYTEFQEPLMNAFQDQFSTNQFAASNNDSSTDANNQTESSNNDNQPRTENRDPLPNPWASQNQTNNSSFPANLLGAAGGASALFGGNQAGGRANTDFLQQASNMFQNPEILTLMTNPEAIQSIEQIQQGLERLQRIAPNLFGRLGLMNPGAGLTAAFRNAGMNPPTDSTNSNDTTTGSLSPDNLSQMLRLLGPLAGLQAPGAGMTPTNTNPTSGSNATGTTTNNTANGATPDLQSPETLNALAQMLSGLGAHYGPNVGSDDQTNSIPPEQRYSQQLQQLTEMGFPNREANLQALVASSGDINAAIARLLPQ